MTLKIRTIDQLVKLSTRVAVKWIDSSGKPNSDATRNAILAVCQQLGATAGFRSDVEKLIEISLAAAGFSGAQVCKASQIQSVDDGDQVPLLASQIEVLGMFAQGLSYQEVAEKLHISERTVENYTNSMFVQLGVKNKSEAILVARNLKLIF